MTYNRLFGPYVAGASRITVKDPYIRKTHQIRNFVEFLETVFTYTDRADEVHVHLIIASDAEAMDRQLEDFKQVQNMFGQLGIVFTYEFSDTGHDRSIVADTGWRVILGRGLDIYQYYDGNRLNPQVRLQKLRKVKEFEVTYVKKDEAD
ncbi:MIT C-terminal domain-containing protein [Bifidobacterium parmae]|uniref:MIT C-terminal domain-containing protein n=1 Tax=Bifidobacterium parmae TaxID=361854 RepID=UPI0013FD1CCD|nr:MIT C-terminal domain-containing protein [Bifidobacterium parmae]